jgi:hypothetical protein
MLDREAVNDFSVTRLDGGDRPSRYPVFIRCEDNHLGVDTDLLHNDEEFDEAVAELLNQGKVLKRRIAVEFCAQPNGDGLYEKYGVINLGGELIPQHILYSDHWMMKKRSPKQFQDGIVETLDFVKTNPHREELGRIFRLANIDYGRIDYSIVNGKVQVYEINTNPNLPALYERPGDDNQSRVERRQILRLRFVEAFNKLNTPIATTRNVRFELPAPPHFVRPWRSRSRLRWMKFMNNYPSLKIFVPRRFW